MTGSHPAGDDPRGGVVLLHGMARTASSMRAMERALGAAGFSTLNLGYPSRRKPLDDLAHGLREPVARFAAGVGGPIHVVTHSMGGLVARTLLARWRPERMGRVVMLGPPNGGSEVADLLRDWRAYRAVFGPAGQQLTTTHVIAASRPVDYEVGVVAGSRSVYLLASLLVLPGPNDGRVTVRSTRLEGMADHITVAAAHHGLARHPEVIRQTVAFIRDGRFIHPAPAARP